MRPGQPAAKLDRDKIPSFWYPVRTMSKVRKRSKGGAGSPGKTAGTGKRRAVRSGNGMQGMYLLVLAFFFLSGVTGLIYEILWIRMIEKIIGNAPFAVSIILAIFMGGLGFGSWLASRVIDRVREPLALVRIYGTLELAIGAYALLVPLLLIAVEPLQAVLYNGLFSHFILYNVLTFVVCAVILLIPVVCMGATLPILCRFYVARLSHLGAHAGRLYGLNTIGAATGSLACGFWLLDLWGVSGTLAFAVLVNLTIGISCLLASRNAKVTLADAATGDDPPRETERDDGMRVGRPGRSPEARIALVVFAVSGFCAMACEVIWTRLLGLIVGPTTYSFTIVLVTFITGLALGSLIFGHLADRVRKAIWLLLFTQMAAALLVLGVSQLLGSSQMFFAKLIFTFRDQFGLLSLMKAAALFAFMILPTLCFGATFPLVGKIYTESVSGVGRSIGFAYMINSLGALAGSFCAGFLLIPLFGKESSLSMVAGLQLAVALVVAGVLLKADGKNRLRFALLAAPALAGLVLSLQYPAWNDRQLSIGKYHRFEGIRSDIMSTGWLGSLLRGPEILSRSEQGELVYYGDGIGGFTTVVKRTNALGKIGYTMTNSGKADASTDEDMKTQTLLAHFPMLLHEDPRTVMVLGLASGITAGEVLLYPVDRLDVLEINDQVVEASRFFDPWNNEVLSDPRTDLIIQDARAHLQLTGRSYDVIISEPSNPWMAGLATLFTRDFFSLARERLNDDGMLVQFIHSYQMDWETFALVGRTFAGVFPDNLLVSTGAGGSVGDYLLVGFKEAGGPDPESAGRRLEYLRRSKNVTLSDPRLLYRLIVSEDLRSLFGEGDVHTDARPLLEFAAPRLMYHEDLQVPKRIEAGREAGLGQGTKEIVRRVETDADARVDFAAYALSVFMPYREMFDLSGLEPVQRERFFRLVEEYCADNEIDYSMIGDEELRQRCLSVQITALEGKASLLSGNPNSCFYLAALYNMKGLASEAIRYYTLGLRLEPGSVVARNDLGNILLNQGRIDEALSQYKEALNLDPRRADVLVNMGNAFKKQGKGAEAITLYSEAVRLEPDNATAHFNLGLVLVDQGRFDEAILHYTEVVRLDPDNAEARNNMGIALYGRGRLDEAIHQFQEALRIRPDYADAQNNLRRVWAKKIELDESRRRQDRQ